MIFLYIFVCFSKFSTLSIYFLISKRQKSLKRKEHFNFKFHISDGLTKIKTLSKCCVAVAAVCGSLPVTTFVSLFCERLHSCPSSARDVSGSPGQHGPCCPLWLCPEATPLTNELTGVRKQHKSEKCMLSLVIYTCFLMGFSAL